MRDARVSGPFLCLGRFKVQGDPTAHAWKEAAAGRVAGHSRTAVALLTLVAGAVGACRDPAAVSRNEVHAGALRVLAASSLVDALPRVGAAWGGGANGDLQTVFDATSRLARQAARGAPGDVFVSADRAWMDWLEERGLVIGGTRQEFLTNQLVLVVPERRAADRMDSLDALLEPATRVALAGDNVPAGRYARAALERMGVWERVASRVVRGGSVRSTLEWVARGDAEAGIVYRTDALVEPRVRIVEGMPPGEEIVYTAAVMSFSPRENAARDFLRFLRAPEARRIFIQAGFGVMGSPEKGSSWADADSSQGPTDLGATSAIDMAGAIRISLAVALACALLGLVPATGVAWLLARHQFRGKSFITTAVMAPLVIPPVVTGFLLLAAFGEQGLGRRLEHIGITIPFSLAGAVLAALVVGFPLYVIAIRWAFEAIDRQYEELSWTLGVNPRRTFFRISLPLAVPGVAAGAVLAFARALGEFGATIVLAGNVEGHTRTIALAVYTLLESPGSHEAIWILVGASVGLSALALLGYELLSSRQARRLERHRV